jgi:molecular chaperone GrpE
MDTEKVNHENELNEKIESVELDAEEAQKMPGEPFEDKNAELNDQLLRALADNQNLRRRLQKEVEEAHQYAVQKFVRDLLSVADNFERALMLVTDELKLDDKFKDFVLGIELTAKELEKVFEQHKIKKIMPQNERFDHNLHQALFDVPNDEVDSGTVLQVVQPGYTLNDRLVRPAMVGISKKTR